MSYSLLADVLWGSFVTHSFLPPRTKGEKRIRDERTPKTSHLLPHNAISGTMMNPLIVANAPELLLHHSFMDKLWYQWQNKGDEYKNVYFPSVPFKLYGSKYYGREWIDSSNLPGQKAPLGPLGSVRHAFISPPTDRGGEMNT